ncbi:unnamed protein product (macronuclear) [Paramecium tetraurelia]|uniref:Protein kinase domain-containing protein n=1 Tax=Paramecium tetraurelia TaxID=5888 RepID=A0CF09_PARTE|nr:uncharacterized protein GSPATT00037815001 [Paramecium tetraurelia]CAK69376.1 unnamed protein product [Paramecium tetraurelia]|eukprot:XP_001436773.1 hypothetical protein (macronuclear) [Paramecium tetraurelia strain d4-2]
MKKSGGLQADHSKTSFFNDGNQLFTQLTQQNLQFQDQGSFQMKYTNRVTQINIQLAENYLKITEEVLKFENIQQKSYKYILIENACLRVVMNSETQQLGIRLSKNGQQAEFYGTNLELVEKLKKYVIQSEFQKKYHIIEKIGSGYISSVYKVRHLLSGQKFAAKIVEKSTLTRSSTLEKDCFLNEINILRQIRHNNLLKLEEIYEGEKNIYIITELLEGGPIEHQILNNHYMEQEKIKVMHTLISSLHSLHQNNIYHNDIRYENILLKDSQDLQTPCLINFGKAMQIPSKRSNVTSSNHLDQEKIINLCIKRDIYSLCTLMLTIFTKKVYNLNQVVDELLMKNFQYLTRIEFMGLCPQLQRFFEMIFTDRQNNKMEILTCEQILEFDIFRIPQKPRNSKMFIAQQLLPILPRRMSKFIPTQENKDKADQSANSIKLPPLNRGDSTSVEKSFSSSPKSVRLLSSHLNKKTKKSKSILRKQLLNKML